MPKHDYVKTEVLKTEREKQGFTYEEMAARMGYRSKSTYMYIENGSTVPTLPVMLKIAHILDKPIEYFFKMDVQDIQTKQIGNEGDCATDTNAPTGTEG